MRALKLMILPSRNYCKTWLPCMRLIPLSPTRYTSTHCRVVSSPCQKRFEPLPFALKCRCTNQLPSNPMEAEW